MNTKWIMIRHTPGRSSTRGLTFDSLDWVNPMKNLAGYPTTVVLEGQTYQIHHADAEYAHYHSVD